MGKAKVQKKDMKQGKKKKDKLKKGKPKKKIENKYFFLKKFGGKRKLLMLVRNGKKRKRDFNDKGKPPKKKFKKQPKKQEKPDWKEFKAKKKQQKQESRENREYSKVTILCPKFLSHVNSKDGKLFRLTKFLTKSSADGFFKKINEWHVLRKFGPEYPGPKNEYQLSKI